MRQQYVVSVNIILHTVELPGLKHVNFGLKHVNFIIEIHLLVLQLLVSTFLYDS